MAIKHKHNIFCVKSSLTIIMGIGLTVLTFLNPKEFAETYKIIANTICVYYFSHQDEKRKSNDVIENSDITN